MKRNDLLGQRFGSLTVESLAPREMWHGKDAEWICCCDCGGTRMVRGIVLKRGDTRSCGCLIRTSELRLSRLREVNVTHGLSRHPLFGVWKNMVFRCYNRRAKGWQNYGGRGITVCERWRTSPAAFIVDMEPRPSPKHSIERIDNDGAYSPENCRWAVAVEQARNRRTTQWITIDGITRPMTEWCELTGIPWRTALGRIKSLGWDPQRAVTAPVQSHQRSKH